MVVSLLSVPLRSDLTTKPPIQLSIIIVYRFYPQRAVTTLILRMLTDLNRPLFKLLYVQDLFFYRLMSFDCRQRGVYKVDFEAAEELSEEPSSQMVFSLVLN